MDARQFYTSRPEILDSILTSTATFPQSGHLSRFFCPVSTRGPQIPVLRDTLGHANVQTTSRYLHVIGEECSGDFV